MRTEKDKYSVQALLENNVLKARKLLDLLSEFPPCHFFCVSTDKAANPVNIMGASKKIMEEIAYMENVKRPEISRAIGEARDKGDLSENAEYDAAKEAQGMLEMKISQLKDLIANARFIDESKLNTHTVQILNKVKIKNTKNNATMQYTIVSESEANLKEGKIAANTPIAKGLLGKQVGDIVDIQVPSGIMTFEIVDISI